MWRYPLLGRAPPQADMTVNLTADGDSEYSFNDGFKLRLGRAAVLRPAYVALVTRDGLVCLDPATRQTRWERADVSQRVQVWGDHRHLFLVETDGQNTHSSRVLRASDGAAVPAPDFAAKYMDGGRRAVLGRHLLIHSGQIGKDRRLWLYDPLTGTEVWSRAVPPQAVVLESADRGLTGFLTAAGRATVFDALTGKPLLEADIAEAARPPGGTSRVQLLADADRFYLFTSAGRIEQHVPSAVGHTQVSGPAYCFDRRTSDLRWHSQRLFVERFLVTDRFADLPALVTCSELPQERPGEANRAALVRVEVVDKATGRVRFHGGYPTAGPFVAVATDPKGHTIDLVRPDVRVRLAQDVGR